MADHDTDVVQEEDVNSECVGDVQPEDSSVKGATDDACPEESVERDVAVVDDVSHQGLGNETGETEQTETEEVEVGAVPESGGAHGTVECEAGEAEGAEGKIHLVAMFYVEFDL